MAHSASLCVCRELKRHFGTLCLWQGWAQSLRDDKLSSQWACGRVPTTPVISCTIYNDPFHSKFWGLDDELRWGFSVLHSHPKFNLRLSAVYKKNIALGDWICEWDKSKQTHKKDWELFSKHCPGIPFWRKQLGQGQKLSFEGFSPLFIQRLKS